MRFARSGRVLLFCGFLLLLSSALRADDGYRLWLRYDPVDDAARLASYRNLITATLIEGNSPTMTAARSELGRGLTGLLGSEPRPVQSVA
ncbi:MAG: alpha-glucuronidase family glycosyl hydrolase, partial [Acidobacteriota bacterium]